MLARIKLTYPEIRDAIWNIDDNKLTVDNLMAIRQYIPTKEEIEIVKEFNGDVENLGNAERYFRSVMYIPRLADRVSCMIFRRRFKQELNEILAQLDVLQYAICELRESVRFKKVLRTVLAIGNYLNGHTIRGNAYGFRLDALLKMRDTRAEGEGSSNTMPTLLHYLVHFLAKSGDDVVDFRDDIVHLEAAAKLSPPTIFASVNALSANLLQINDELNLHRRRRTSVSQIDRFADSMEEFLMEANPIGNNLKSMTKDIDEKLKELILYYGEDPTTVKSEEFFDIIYTFSSSFAKAQVEIHEARERALRRQRQQEMILKKQKPRVSMSSSCSSRNSSVASSTSTLSRSTSYSSVTSDSNPQQGPNQMVSLSPLPPDLTKGDDTGFDNVLKELRAGLKHSDHSWKIDTPSPLVMRYRQRKAEQNNLNDQRISILQT
ncbi:hypothetical protein INT45_009386 [Circinella minor]|uniref:FH2 domain-containing protein n=1 Tax=Circinella minor TaxID=1195481 RepID=A0A8H7S5G1_9FUNG|nr:hypothetical protein INT45_009386 [Circinella minor]